MAREAIEKPWSRPRDRCPSTPGEGTTHKQAQPDGHYLQVIKPRSGNHLAGVTIQVIYEDPEEVRERLGTHTACTHLTSQQMNGRLVRKTSSFSQERERLEDSCVWEDGGIQPDPPGRNLAHRGERWATSVAALLPGGAASLTDHIWTVKELLMTVVPPHAIKIRYGDCRPPVAI